MSSRKNIKQILDSDDELPFTYEEVPLIPAYQDDNRFSDIALYKLTKDDSDLSVESSSEISSQESDETKNNPTEMQENNVLMKGVLRRKDAYCIKVLGTQFDDETLLWFINFTISKDIQSNYSFLASCLVVDIFDNEESIDVVNIFERKQKYCESKYFFEYQ